MTHPVLVEPIGGSDKLFAWGEGEAIKLYGDGVDPEWLEALRQRESALHDAGLPVPRVGALLEIDGQYGQVYEHIQGPSLAQALFAAPDPDPETIVALGRTFAQAQAAVHANTSAPSLAPQKQVLAECIGRPSALASDLRQATLALLADMPVGTQLCHGDYHPFNVLLSPRGPIVIDWNNAHTGVALEDVARSLLILDGAAISDGLPETLLASFREAYLSAYQQAMLYAPETLAVWRPIVAAVRFCDQDPALEDWLTEQVRAGLHKLGRL